MEKFAKKDTRAVISTKYGEIELKFYFDVAPRHCESFLKLAENGFYNGTTFHRVNPAGLKVVQGGDPNTKGTNRGTHGLGGPGYAVPAEFNSRPHRRGTLSMARGNDPNSAGSQFFICADDCGSLDWQYTVFGEVARGLDTVDQILTVRKDGNDNPLDRIEMTVTVKHGP
jgi:peptidyl-prolyl cis-trans isomerase B (cyclophilin B)